MQRVMFQAYFHVYLMLMSTNIFTHHMLSRKQNKANIKCMVNAEIPNEFKINYSFHA